MLARLHRSSFLLLVTVLLLYGPRYAFASDLAPPSPASSPLPSRPHIALLLPLSSGAFVHSAEALRDGFLAAAKVEGGTTLPLRIYASSPEPRQIVEGYHMAIEAGARLVVGPLTRDGVSAVATSNLVAVPTLALNVPEREGPLPRQLYMLSLNIEAEARAVARVAYEDGHRRAYAIVGNDPLSKRMYDAFTAEFQRLGGTNIDEQMFVSERTELEHLKRQLEPSSADCVFLALDADRAQVVRPYVSKLAMYATSQVYPGAASPLVNFDLGGIRFVGMPWLLQPDHPAVMIYPRPQFDNVDLERLYALGIDAFRIGQEILKGHRDIVLDGVTGDLRLADGQEVRRGLLVAEFIAGKVALIGSTEP